MKEMKVRYTDLRYCAKYAFSNGITQKGSAYACQKITQVPHFMVFNHYLVKFKCRI